MLLIEGDSNSVIITILEEDNNGGYTGPSYEISKETLVNKLITEGILEDGETVYYEE